MKSCKTCKHWDRDKAKDKAGRIRSHAVVPCLFPMPKLPESIGVFDSTRDRELRWMAAGYGGNCETYEKINKEQNMTQKTININGIEVPEPMRVAPEMGDKYYFTNPSSSELAIDVTWADDGCDNNWLPRGLCHTTKEAAITHAKALLSFTEVKARKNMYATWEVDIHNDKNIVGNMIIVCGELNESFRPVDYNFTHELYDLDKIFDGTEGDGNLLQFNWAYVAEIQKNIKEFGRMPAKLITNTNAGFFLVDNVTIAIGSVKM